MHAIFCSWPQNFDNSNSINCHFCIKFGHFDAKCKRQTVKMFVEKYIATAENECTKLKTSTMTKFNFHYEPRISNFFPTKNIVWKTKTIMTTRAWIVRQLFHLNLRLDNDRLFVPISGITPNIWPIINNGRTAIRKVPSKQLFSSGINFKINFLFQVEVSSVQFKYIIDNDLDYYRFVVKIWIPMMVV